MPARLEDVEALFAAVKHLRDERRKMQKLSDKARDAEQGKPRQKLTTDLNWQAFHINRIEHRVHAMAVNAGVADLRSPKHYEPYSVKLTGFHEYEVVPTKPRDLMEQCQSCGGSGLCLDGAGEPDECRECGGNTVVPVEQANAEQVPLL